MECLVEKTILDLPDETLEHIMTFLSFSDLFKLSKEGHRLECCAKRILKEKPFCKYNIKLFILSCHLINVRKYNLVNFFILECLQPLPL